MKRHEEVDVIAGIPEYMMLAQRVCTGMHASSPASGLAITVLGAVKKLRVFMSG